ncbi:hypothetical protein V1509DRAFT_612899 [Lipomyces kononenkoae]
MNQKYRVWYDGDTHKVTINCYPSDVHEGMSTMVVDSMVDEARRVMHIAGVSDDVISRIRKAGPVTRTSLYRGKSHKEPDGLIEFKDPASIHAGRIALEVGFSQSYSSLQRATLWWIEQKKATVAVMLCLTEIEKSSSEVRRQFGSIEELTLLRTTNTGASHIRAAQYNGYKWFGILRDAFFETYHQTDCGVIKSEPVYLVKDAVDITESIPSDLTVTVGDFVPYGWVNDDDVRRLAVKFLQPKPLMEELSDAVVSTALQRVQDAFEVQQE